MNLNAINQEDYPPDVWINAVVTKLNSLNINHFFCSLLLKVPFERNVRRSFFALRCWIIPSIVLKYLPDNLPTWKNDTPVSCWTLFRHLPLTLFCYLMLWHTSINFEKLKNNFKKCDFQGSRKEYDLFKSFQHK